MDSLKCFYVLRYSVYGFVFQKDIFRHMLPLKLIFLCHPLSSDIHVIKTTIKYILSIKNKCHLHTSNVSKLSKRRSCNALSKTTIFDIFCWNLLCSFWHCTESCFSLTFKKHSDLNSNMTISSRVIGEIKRFFVFVM